MIEKPLDSITLEDIESLRANAMPESKTIEYKTELPGDSGDERRKLLRALCSFANTSGGDLIYGVSADNGIPSGLPGISSDNRDGLKLRIENSARDSIQPRLPHLQFKFIPVNEQRDVLVIRVPQSWNSPHRLNQDGHFYARNSAGSYQLDVGELRQAFTLSESVAERIRGFRADRLIQISAGGAPVEIDEYAKLILHVVPLSSFMSHERIDIDSHKQRLREVPTLGPYGGNTKINLDGLVTFDNNGNEPSSTYTQVFRSGVIEAVESFIPWQNTKYVAPEYYEPHLLERLPKYLQTLRDFGIEPPFYVFLSMVKVADYQLVPPRGIIMRKVATPDRDSLVLPEVVISDFDTTPEDALTPLLGMFWNAFGMTRPENFRGHS